MNEVPWLRSGTGRTPSDGGCIMQVIDWIDRNEWTDSPPCVHPVLAKLAIRANDTLDDAGRQKLLDLAPRLMGTGSDDKMLSVKLAVFCARRVLRIFEEKYSKDSRPRLSIEAAEAWIAEPTEENRLKAVEARKNAAYAADAAYADAAAAAYAADAAAAAAYAADAAADAAYAAYADAAAAAYAADAADAAYASYLFLVEVLDEYERIVGPRQKSELDFTPVCKVMASTT